MPDNDNDTAADRAGAAALAELDRLLDASPAQRAVLLAQLRASRPALHARVAALLAAAEAADSHDFLSGPPPAADPPGEDALRFAAGERFDVYRLERPLGRGGMGEVWLARRADGAFDAPVALKLLHPHMAAGTGRDRFRREGRILGSLAHPNIARLLDAGVSEEGQHFLVLEYVEGEPIDRWCDGRRLDVPARVRLFLQVCAAVAFAHAHLVVHRDLKPSNILVTGDGTVKLLDFGIAKLIEPEGSTVEATELTRLGGGALTPEYAAPEQVLGAAVTTATDVYALGGLLYRLLTGRRPYGAPGKAAAQLAFDVLQTEPRAAAEVVTQRTGDGADAAALAALRATTPRLLSRQLGGDLDAIVAKALRKEAAGRYPDARALADELERHLNHEPVRARDGARAYRWRRFIRRNWMPVSALAALIVVLMAGIAAVAWQAAQTRREAQRASAVTDFLISMFRASDPRIAQDQPRGRITARDLLDRSAARIPSHFADDPETEIRLLGVTADIYRELDETDRYRELHRQQIELARRLYGDLHPAITKGLLDEAEMDIDRDHGNDALKLLDEADPLIRRAGRDRTAVRARWLLLRSQALSFSERYAAERQRDALAAVALYRDVAPQDPGRVSALSELGTYSYERDDYRTAIGEYIKAIALAQTLPNRDDGELTIIYNNLALAYEVVGEFDAAEKAYRAAEDLTERTYGKHHRNYWKLYADHARLVHLRGDRLRALQMFDALETLIPADAPMGVELAEVRFEQAASLLAEGRPQLAIPMLEACKRFYVKWPLNDFTVRRVRAALGDAYAATGRLDAARRELKQALDEYVAREAPDSDGVRDTRERWGRLLMLEHDDAGAAAQFREIIARGGRHVDSETVRAWADLTQLATRRGDADAAEDARHALQAYKNLSGYFDVRIGPYVWARAAAALLVSGDAAGAAGLAGQALDASRRYDAPESVEIGAAAATLAAARQALGRTAAAPAEPGSAPALTPAAKPVDHALAQPPSR